MSALHHSAAVDTPSLRHCRRLSLEQLESRQLLSVTVAQRLDEIAINAGVLEVTPSGLPPDPGGQVLAIGGSDASDRVLIRPIPGYADAAVVVVNGQRSVHGDLGAIVVYGGHRHDRILSHPNLPIKLYLLGGRNNDMLVGGAADDVIVGGDAVDVLRGNGGNDVVIGGRGEDYIFGMSGTDGDGGAENLLVSDDLFTPEDLPFLRDLAETWNGSGTRAEREYAVNVILGTNLRRDYSVDYTNAVMGTDYAVTSLSRGDVLSAFEPMYVDGNGFDSLRVTSNSQDARTKIRILLPDDYNPAKAYRVVYVLPVEAGEGSSYGDGLRVVRDAGLADSKDVIFVSPTFSDLPWYCDHATDLQVRQATYFRYVVAPYIEQMYLTPGLPEGRLLLGFSKSGYGAFSLLLRNSEYFGRALAWDSPLNMSTPLYGFGDILGSSANFENYRVPTLLRNHADEFIGQPQRFILYGYSSLKGHLDAIDDLMNDLHIPHLYDSGTHRSHRWDSGWVPHAVDMLVG